MMRGANDGGERRDDYAMNFNPLFTNHYLLITIY